MNCPKEYLEKLKVDMVNSNKIVLGVTIPFWLFKKYLAQKEPEYAVYQAKQRIRYGTTFKFSNNKEDREQALQRSMELGTLHTILISRFL